MIKLTKEEVGILIDCIRCEMKNDVCTCDSCQELARKHKDLLDRFEELETIELKKEVNKKCRKIGKK